LVQFGLTEGASNTHPGQGTACRRFFFRNAMLELLWVKDQTEAGSDAVRPTHLLDRWLERSGNASPFGICLRPSQPIHQEVPFSGWKYRPPYLPEGLSIHVADNAAVLAEPILFYLTFAQRPDTLPSTQPLDHPIRFQEITGLRVTSPQSEPASSGVAALEHLDIATFVSGREHCIEIEFDGRTQSNTTDFRPHLPLVFHW
jgi:hypothetical protein